MAGLDPGHFCIHGVVPAKAGTHLDLRGGLILLHVYILAGARNGTLYIGVTNNVAARLESHRLG